MRARRLFGSHCDRGVHPILLLGSGIGMWWWWKTVRWRRPAPPRGMFRLGWLIHLRVRLAAQATCHPGAHQVEVTACTLFLVYTLCWFDEIEVRDVLPCSITRNVVPYQVWLRAQCDSGGRDRRMVSTRSRRDMATGGGPDGRFFVLLWGRLPGGCIFVGPCSAARVPPALLREALLHQFLAQPWDIIVTWDLAGWAHGRGGSGRQGRGWGGRGVGRRDLSAHHFLPLLSETWLFLHLGEEHTGVVEALDVAGDLHQVGIWVLREEIWGRQWDRSRRWQRARVKCWQRVSWPWESRIANPLPLQFWRSVVVWHRSWTGSRQDRRAWGRVVGICSPSPDSNPTTASTASSSLEQLFDAVHLGTKATATGALLAGIFKLSLKVEEGCLGWRECRRRRGWRSRWQGLPLCSVAHNCASTSVTTGSQDLITVIPYLWLSHHWKSNEDKNEHVSEGSVDSTQRGTSSFHSQWKKRRLITGAWLTCDCNYASGDNIQMNKTAQMNTIIMKCYFFTVLAPG